MLRCSNVGSYSPCKPFLIGGEATTLKQLHKLRIAVKTKLGLKKQGKSKTRRNMKGKL